MTTNGLLKIILLFNINYDYSEFLKAKRAIELLVFIELDRSTYILMKINNKGLL